MNEEIKGLPIKYTLEPIYTKDGWDSLGYDKGKLDFYIVTKCYLIREITEYSEFDQPQKYYQVIFPFDNNYFYGDIKSANDIYIKRILKERKQIPEYSAMGSGYINLKTTNKLYDTLEDALKERNNLNITVFASGITCDFNDSNWKEKYNKEKEEFNNKVETLQEFVLKHTEELTAGENKVRERKRAF